MAKTGNDTRRLWEANESTIRSNWPVTRSWLRAQFGLDINTSKRLFAYAMKQIAAPSDDTKVVIASDDANEHVISAKGPRIKTLDQLLEVTETNLREWEVKHHKVNSWEVGAKGPDGSIITETLFQVTAHLERRFNANQLQTVIYDDVHSNPNLFRAPNPFPTALIIPDIQMGFRWQDNYSRLNPMHDRLAMDIVWQAAEIMQPTEVIFVGDVFDYAAFGKFQSTPDMRQTTQPTLNEFYWWLARLRQSCPDSKLVWIAGNHEARKDRNVFDAVSELYYIKRAGSSNHVLSHTELLGLDDLKVKIIEPYNSEYWLWSTIRVHHGREHKTAKIVQSMQYHSEIQGHSHRLALNAKTMHGPTGPRVIYSMQPGCLCKNGKEGPPAYEERNDWQQGFGVVSLPDNLVTMQVHSIQHGKAYFNNTTIAAVDRSEQIAVDIGWNQIR